MISRFCKGISHKLFKSLSRKKQFVQRQASSPVTHMALPLIRKWSE